MVKLVHGKQSIYKGREVWIVKLKGINSPEEVTDIRGHILLISASQREVLEDDDEFYVQELIGLKVEMLDSGDEIGTVIDVLDGTGTYDVLRIEHFETDVEGNARKSLLPFAKELVPVVDLEQKVLRVTPPEGLFDQPVSPPKKDTKKQPRRRGKKPLQVQTEE
jgi:16S rRNA processing protein RimM